MHGMKYYHDEFMFAGGGYEPDLVKALKQISGGKTITPAMIDAHMTELG